MHIDPKYILDLNNLLFRVGLCLPKAGDYATVAGGAIRDMLLDTEIADIDVFFDAPDINESKLKGWFKKVEVCEHGLYEDSSFNVLYKITSLDFPVPVQLIQVKGYVQEHIKQFPTPLSRVSYNRIGGLQGIDSTFLLNAKTKRVWFDRPVNYQYLTKMQEKFPDWEFAFAEKKFNPAYMVELDF